MEEVVQASLEDLKTKIRVFLSKYIKAELNDSDDFFKLKYLNSLFAMQLVTFVEKHYEIRVEDDDLEITNFNTVENLAKFVLNKLS